MSKVRQLALAVLLLSCGASAQILGYENFCQTGGQSVTTQGLQSITHVQRSYPSCTVTVYFTGTTNKAPIFKDSLSTPLVNPFTANIDGSFLFYAGPTVCYDVTISGGNTGDSVPSPFTYTDQCLGAGGASSGLPAGCSATSTGQITCTGTPGFIGTQGILAGPVNIINLPVLPPIGTKITVRNGQNPSDCSSGGGSDVHDCQWTGVIWNSAGGGSGGGVSSVGLALPSSLFTISNSPVTGVGTLTGTFVSNFTANDVFGNCTASPATPAPCALVSAMLPPINLASTANGGITGTLATGHGGTGTASTLTGIVRGGSAYTAAELSGDATTSGSNVVSVVGMTFGATDIPTGTAPTAGQCIQYNGSVFTGGTCTGGSGGPTISTNGVNNTSQAVLNFQNPSTFNGMTFTYSNPSGGNETFSVGGALSNNGLANSATTVNSQSCVLGSTCNIPFSTNSVNNTSLAGINFLNPSNFNGLTFTFTNPSTNNESFSVGGTLNNAGLTSPSVTVNGQTCTLGSTCNVNAGAANPSLSQNNGNGSALSAASGHTVAIPRLCSDSSGSGTAQSCSTSPSFTPGSGDEIIYTTTTSNTGDVTLNVNATAAKHVHKWSGSSILGAGDLVSNVPVLMVYDGTFWEVQTIGNAPSGGGGGTVNTCSTIGSIAYYPAAGATISCDPSVNDNGSGTLSMVSAQTTGATAGYVGLGGSTSNPSLSANSAGLLGPSVASLTSYAIQFPSTGPSANNVMLLGAQVGGISPITFGTVPNAALTNSSTTVNTQSCSLGGSCTLGFSNIAAGALANGTTATTQSTGDATADVATDSFVTTAVNNAIAGVNPAVAVLAATTGSNLTGTYANGASGIGATFTITATGAFTLDGVAINTIGQRVLLKDQTSGFQNGVYTATIVGTTGVSPVFTRALDYDQPSDINTTGQIPVQSGTVNATTGWLLTSTVNTVGTDGLTYVQFTLSPSSIVTAASNFTNGQPVQAAGANKTLATATGHGMVLPLTCADSSGSGTAQSCSTTPSFTPASGDCIVYSTTTSNTGALTVNVNSLGAKAVQKWLGSALASGDLPLTVSVQMCYDGTHWQLPVIGNAPSGAVSSVSNSDGTLTISPTSGAVVGSLALGHANTWSALQTFGSNASIATTAHGVLLSENTSAAAATAAGTAGQILTSGGSGADGAYKDFPEHLIIPAANCNNATAGAGWSIPASNAPTAACRAGTNNLGGVLQWANNNTTTNAQFTFQLPTDWDTGTQPYWNIIYGSGANTSGTIKWTISSACTKADGSVTDDPAFVAETTSGGKTMATANRGWAESAQFANITSGNNCIAGSTVIVKIVSGNGTATSTVNVEQMTVTVPRLLTVQAN